VFLEGMRVDMYWGGLWYNDNSHCDISSTLTNPSGNQYWFRTHEILALDWIISIFFWNFKTMMWRTLNINSNIIIRAQGRLRHDAAQALAISPPIWGIIYLWSMYVLVSDYSGLIFSCPLIKCWMALFSCLVHLLWANMALLPRSCCLIFFLFYNVYITSCVNLVLAS
jgi:hypothetical protein